jgi:hypothetical protein
MFTASTLATDTLGLRDLLQRFADERWLPANATPDNRAAIVLRDFKLRVLHDLEALELTWTEGRQCGHSHS